ncbi:MAG: purine-nucleoside phosphorylase [Bacillota bacterium]
MALADLLNETVGYLRQNTVEKPEIGLVLGSGLGILAEKITKKQAVSYAEIPNFPVSTVEGHQGQLVFGTISNKSVVAMQGRFHFYEGYSLAQVTYPIRVMKLLGVKTLIVTNAAGGINLNFKPGDLMLISDHINLLGSNPLIGENIPELGPRFPDMSDAYDKQLREKVKQIADAGNIALQEGVYAAVTGPSYETPAEIRYLRTIGVDAVGMSTVPEVIVANHCGIKVIGISCITNMAAGVLDKKLDHQEVMETAALVKEKFITLVQNIITNL